MIRPLYPEEIHLLRDFLYEAIFIPEGVEPSPRDVVDLPELRLYVEDFGKKKDDYCLVVEQNGKGAWGSVWIEKRTGANEKVCLSFLCFSCGKRMFLLPEPYVSRARNVRFRVGKHRK